MQPALSIRSGAAVFSLVGQPGFEPTHQLCARETASISGNIIIQTVGQRLQSHHVSDSQPAARSQNSVCLLANLELTRRRMASAI